MKVLVTGATGFLGSHLCRKLGEAGYAVTAACRAESNREILNGLNLPYRIADLTAPDSLAAAVRDQDAVIHAAAEIRYASPEEVLARVNTAGTQSLAQICRQQKIGRFLYVSSVAAVGIPPAGTIADERFPFNLEHSGLHYHISKRRAEEAVLREAALGLNAVIVNPASGFGPHGRFFRGGEMIRKVRESEVATYFRGGICAVHVDDAASGIVAALERGLPGERYILGGENLTYQEIVRRSAAALRVKRYAVPIGPAVTRLGMLLRPARFSYATHYTAGRLQFYSSEKAAQTFGYRPRGFAEILREYIAFMDEAQPLSGRAGAAAKA